MGDDNKINDIREREIMLVKMLSHRVVNISGQVIFSQATKGGNIFGALKEKQFN